MKDFAYVRHIIRSAIVLAVAFVLAYGFYLVLQGNEKLKILFSSKEAKADVPSPPK